MNQLGLLVFVSLISLPPRFQCKGILKPGLLDGAWPPKDIDTLENDGQVSTGSLNVGSISDSVPIPPPPPGAGPWEPPASLPRGDPSKCEPSIYLAPVLNISTQTIERKLVTLTRQVQQLNEQVRLLTSRGLGAPNTQGSGQLLPRDCKEIIDGGASESGAYVIQPEAIGRPIRVYCDMDTDGGGWTVFQRRINGSENFRRSWPMYRRGFGDVTSEFWLGLDALHRITVTDEFELRVELQDFDDITMTSTYSWMRVDDITSNFRLHLGEYSGIAGDALGPHDRMEFSTFDRDNDALKGDSCSLLHGGGGWWFADCLEANPNGLYLGGGNRMTSQGVTWNAWKGPNYSMKRVEMKLRPCVGD